MVTLDVFDYAGNLVCNLYDSESSASGQAHDIISTTQRNGWKELTFAIPGNMEIDDGAQQENFRVSYLKADYKLRLYAVDDDGNGLLESHYDSSTGTFVRDKCDWYLISGPKITHENYTHNITVAAGHVSQLLKTKNLGLVFSDTEGNNVGTASDLLSAVLEGTGWSVGYVEEFLEKYTNTEKQRSLIASERTGTFALITKIADLFEAKAIFHGENNTVDMVHMNPFSEPADGGLPDVTTADGVFELHYGKNVKNITKTLSTENMVTRLYAYGSYGDTTTGYCGIDEIQHTEWTFNCNVSAGRECSFTATSDSGISRVRYFTPTFDVNGTVVFSDFDPASMMYVWDPIRMHAYRVYTEPQTSSFVQLGGSSSKVDNMFSSVMDFTYYDEVGLFTDQDLQALALYQRSAPDYLAAVSAASASMSDEINTLSQIVGSVSFVKLQNPTFDSGEAGNTRINFNGLSYTTEYMMKERDQFTWRAATSLKSDGDAMNKGASVVYIVRNADPLTFEKYFFKTGGKSENYITLWDTFRQGYFDGARVYLLSSNSAYGYLSSAEDAVSSIEENLAEQTKGVSVIHPTYFSITPPSFADIGTADDLAYSESPPYGWWWQYADSNNNPAANLYFYYPPINDSAWVSVSYSGGLPSSITPNTFHYNWRDKLLRYYSNGAWTVFDKTNMLRISQQFDTVISSCLRRNAYYYGYYNEYTYDVSSALPIGNYAMQTDYGIYWLFTTDKVMPAGSQLIYNTTNKQVTERVSNVTDVTLESKHFGFDALTYHPANAASGVDVLSDTTLVDNSSLGTYGSETSANGYYTTRFIRVYPLIPYTINLANCVVFFYDENNNAMRHESCTGTFNTFDNVRYVRITTTSNILQTKPVVTAVNYDDLVIAENESYNVITPYPSTGEDNVLKGLITQLKAFADSADKVYATLYGNLKQAQTSSTTVQTNMANTLGPMYREGWWQKESYVDGDEQKLYDDALDTLSHIAHPEETYSIGFIDYRDAILDSSNGMLPDYQNITVRSAAHLIDDDTGISKWAFIDTIKTCYDQPWKTQVQINTNLTTMSQHTFADVMAHIAEIANNLSGRQTLYGRAAVVGRYGKILAEAIEGQFNIDKIKITTAQSNVYQDDHGNWIFESVDGTSAMMLTGAGFGVASSKDENGDWNWRTFGTGEGFTADLITSGHIRANLIEAGTITTEMIAAPVGSELNLIGNQSVKIIADSAIYDTEYSSGVNLLRGATNQEQSATISGTGFLINNVELSADTAASDHLSFRVHLAPTNCSVHGAICDYSHSNTWYSGTTISSGETGWSTLSFVLPSSVERIGAYIVADTLGTNPSVLYHSAKVEYGEVPTEFSKCPDDLENAVKNLERAVLDVNPSYISASVKNIATYSKGNLYTEAYDTLAVNNANVAYSKNVQHGISLSNVPSSGVVLTVTLSQLSGHNSNYTVSFMAKSSANATLKCKLYGGSEYTFSLTANTDTKIVAPFSNATTPLTITLIPSATCTLDIASLMVESGLVASEWVASSVPDPMAGANILSNGGFSLYGTTGVVGTDQYWTPTNATAYVCNNTMNTGSQSGFVDPSCNILAVLRKSSSTSSITYKVAHTSVSVISGEYYTFSCNAASYLNTACTVSISNASAYNGNTSVSITAVPSSSIDSYQYIEIPFKATSSSIVITVSATASNSDARFFLYHCKLEKGINATMYSDPVVNTLYESYNKTAGDVLALEERMTNAEVLINSDSIVSKVIESSQYQNGLEETKQSTLTQVAETYAIQFDTINELSPATSWFTFGTDSSGRPALKLGTSTSTFSTELTNSKLAFKQGNNDVAYISNSKLYITNGEFTNGFTIGKLTASVDSDGSINWTWL